MTKREPPQPTEESEAEEAYKRMKNMLEPAGEMAIHIHRDDMPDEEWRREHARESISEILDAFPDEQIEIRRRGGEMSADQSNLTAFDVETVSEGACVRYDICENTVPERGQICGPCLDTVRAADRERQEGR